MLDWASKPAPQQAVVFDETRCCPASFELAAGGAVTVKVASGPKQSFTFCSADGLGDDADEEHTPLYPAGETSQPWRPSRPGRYLIRSTIYPRLQSEVTVVPAAQRTHSNAGEQRSAVDEALSLPGFRASPASNGFNNSHPQLLRVSRTPPSAKPPTVFGGSASGSGNSGGGSGFQGLRASFRRDTAQEEADADDESSPPGCGLRRRRAAGRAYDSYYATPSSGSERSSTPDTGEGYDGWSPVQQMKLFDTSGGSSQALQELSGQRTAAVVAAAAARSVASPPAATPPPRQHKCLKCPKEFVCAANQRRCGAAHAAGVRARDKRDKSNRGGVEGTERAQAFWDGLSAEARAGVFDVASEEGGAELLAVLTAAGLAAPAQHGEKASALAGRGAVLARLSLPGADLERVSGKGLLGWLAAVTEDTLHPGLPPAPPADVSAARGLEAYAALGGLLWQRLEAEECRQREALAEALLQQAEAAAVAAAPEPPRSKKKKSKKKAGGGKAAVFPAAASNAAAEGDAEPEEEEAAVEVEDSAAGLHAASASSAARAAATGPQQVTAASAAQLSSGGDDAPTLPAKPATAAADAAAVAGIAAAAGKPPAKPHSRYAAAAALRSGASSSSTSTRGSRTKRAAPANGAAPEAAWAATACSAVPVAAIEKPVQPEQQPAARSVQQAAAKPVQQQPAVNPVQQPAAKPVQQQPAVKPTQRAQTPRAAAPAQMPNTAQPAVSPATLPSTAAAPPPAPSQAAVSATMFMPPGSNRGSLAPPQQQRQQQPQPQQRQQRRQQQQATAHGAPAASLPVLGTPVLPGVPAPVSLPLPPPSYYYPPEAPSVAAPGLPLPAGVYPPPPYPHGFHPQPPLPYAALGPPPHPAAMHGMPPPPPLPLLPPPGVVPPLDVPAAKPSRFLAMLYASLSAAASGAPLPPRIFLPPMPGMLVFDPDAAMASLAARSAELAAQYPARQLQNAAAGATAAVQPAAELPEPVALTAAQAPPPAVLSRRTSNELSRRSASPGSGSDGGRSGRGRQRSAKAPASRLGQPAGSPEGGKLPKAPRPPSPPIVTAVRRATSGDGTWKIQAHT